ncbi:hypothetical protein [Chryseolinea lacunae]|uniref:DUF3592 domain-containing protein n=1 Tax=Chryseolinea lacunae TaxID=2801331 RepID=A0ABS1KW57_9BACT|nr:hypothetical protein [Chryseolinea lacunae]MBL0743696.1 hypothetical protein [Chryseolinea lacunae]
MIQQARPVTFRTQVEVVRRHSVFFILGTVFTFIPLSWIIMFTIFNLDMDMGAKDVDYDNINANGKQTTPTLTNIETQDNIAINNKHPSILTYTYSSENGNTESKFRTLAPDQVDRMKVGDKVDVKYLGQESIIVGLDQFGSPTKYIYGGITVFLIVGLSFLIYLFFRAKHELDLFRYGKVVDAELISVSPRRGGAKQRMRPAVDVHYQYTTSSGQKILAESWTNDLLVLNGKKHGDVIKVFVSPVDEGKSCLIPRLEAVRNGWGLIEL